jgi:hypothetical protein
MNKTEIKKCTQAGISNITPFDVCGNCTTDELIYSNGTGGNGNLGISG